MLLSNKYMTMQILICHPTFIYSSIFFSIGDTEDMHDHFNLFIQTIFY